MEAVEKKQRYRLAVEAVLNELIEAFHAENDPVQTQVIRDQEGGHYLLFSNGWKGVRRIYGCFVHIDLADDGKVWLQHDGTDLVVGQMLLDRGVAKSDLVLAFHHPAMRKDTGLAVA
jgi:hypothetical protein